MGRKENKIFDLLELVSKKKWQTTNALLVVGKDTVYSRRESYEANLKILEEKGYIEKKVTSQKVGVKTEWLRKK